MLENGAAIRTAAVESEDPTAALAVLDTIGLGVFQNVNYVLALKRTVGMEPLGAIGLD